MEIEEVKKILRYDEYTVNEFVRGLVKARKDIDAAKEELATRADNVSAKLQDIEKEITEEELQQNQEEIENIKQERKRIEKILPKWEKEKERILGRLTKKKEENENKIAENEQKISDLENEINANEAKMSELDQESKEYEELEQENLRIRSKISRTKGNITRYDKKKANIIEIMGNLETENVLEGLTPPKTIERAKTLPGKNIRKLNEDKEKTEVAMEEPHQAEEEISNDDNEEEISSLEEQIRSSAQRMKEYKENGNYDQEAEEHAYYNGLVSKLSSLRTKNETPVQENDTVEVDEPTQPEVEVEVDVPTQPAVEVNADEQTKTEAEVKVDEPTQPKVEVKAEEPVQTASATTVQQRAQTAKATRTTTAQRPVQTTSATKTATVEQPVQTAKTARTTVEQPTKTTTAETKVEEPVQTEPTKSEQPTPKEVQWNSKLTPEQIEELIAEGIEPGDNEYNLYLWNHGINPFESQMKAKATQKTEVDEVLQKYRNDGFGKNAFGWYFNPWTSEYDKEYDPHKDPEYNDKIARESKTTTKAKEEKETATEEPKAEKLSLKQRIKNLFNRIKDTIKRYIDNFNNKKLPEGTEKQTQDLSEQERAEYVAKANEVLEETLSTENVLNQNTRRAMQGRNDFVSKVHISDDLMQKIENGEQPKTEEIDQEER